MKFLLYFIIFIQICFATNMFDITLLPEKDVYRGGDQVTILFATNSVASKCGTASSLATETVEVVVMNDDFFYSTYHTLASAIDVYDVSKGRRTDVTVASGSFVYSFPFNFPRCDCGKDLWFNVRLVSDNDCKSAKSPLWEFDETGGSIVFKPQPPPLSVRSGGSITFKLFCYNVQGFLVVVELYESIWVLADKRLDDAVPFIRIDGVKGNEFTVQEAIVDVPISLVAPTFEDETVELYFYATIDTGSEELTAESSIFRYETGLFSVVITEPNAASVWIGGETYPITWTLTPSAGTELKASDRFEIRLLDTVTGEVYKVITNGPSLTDQTYPTILVPQHVKEGRRLQLELIYDEDPSYTFVSETFAGERPAKSIGIKEQWYKVTWGSSSTIELSTQGFAEVSYSDLKVKWNDVVISSGVMRKRLIDNYELELSAPESDLKTSYFFAQLELTLLGQSYNLQPIALISSVGWQCTESKITVKGHPEISCFAGDGTFEAPTTAMVDFGQSESLWAFEIEWIGRQCSDADVTVDVRLAVKVDGVPVGIGGEVVMRQGAIVSQHFNAEGVSPIPISIWNVAYPTRNFLTFDFAIGGNGAIYGGYEPLVGARSFDFEHEELDCDGEVIVTNPPLQTGAATSTTARVAGSTRRPIVIHTQTAVVVDSSTSTAAAADSPNFWNSYTGYAIIGVSSGTTLLFICALFVCFIICARSPASVEVAQVRRQRSLSDTSAHHYHSHGRVHTHGRRESRKGSVRERDRGSRRGSVGGRSRSGSGIAMRQMYPMQPQRPAFI